MGRRRFDHLWIEICVAAGRQLPRYDLWLRLHALGSDPEDLTREDALAFCDGELDAFLRARGGLTPPRRRRRLRRAVARFDPRAPTPEERLAALTQ